MPELFRCANCLAPLRLDTGPIATCAYCGAQTSVDAPKAVAGAPVATGRRLAETISFVTTTGRSIAFLDANAPVPIFRTQTLSTARDDQDKLEVHMQQGTHDVAKFDFPLEQRGPRGVAKIALTVRVAASGAMSMTLAEPGTHNEMDRDGMTVSVVG